MKMISNSEPEQSGRFLLRMPPELHAALRADARASGLSLNAYCVRRLGAISPSGAADEDARALVERAREVAGAALRSVLLHGSWARGEATPGSDVDALIVVDSSLPLTRAVYRAWDSRPVAWRARRLDPHFARFPAAAECSGLWAEVALDGIVLWDHDWKLSAHLARIRRRIAGGRLVRRVVHGQPYWTEAA